MLSVLIPVHNFDVTQLVNELHKQAKKEKIVFEIILIDDCSEGYIKSINSELANLENVFYYEESVNIGRSKIRNKLAQQASYEHLVFMDCDSKVTSHEFIKNYVNLIGKHEVVCGGRVYGNKDDIKEVEKLHWLYGVKREQWSAKLRNRTPNKSFQTNNFLVTKQTLLNVRFNEKLVGYGHEDTLFGYELFVRQVKIHHIDNPLEHIGLETGEDFLRKTREGIANLKRIIEMNRGFKGIANDVKILNIYKKLKFIGLNRALEVFYRKYGHALKRNLLGEKPKLLFFDLYKIGYLCEISRNQ